LFHSFVLFVGQFVWLASEPTSLGFIPDAPIIDGAASPHEGLTQTQETQEMEEVVVEALAQMEQGECIVNSDGGDTLVVDGG
jgi:hypothetical protein